MQVTQEVLASNNSVVIDIKDKFDFSIHQQFRNAYIDCLTPETTFVVNLSHASYMDSSALGMVLLLKDHAEKHHGRVIIKKPNETIRKVLEIAQFHRIFTIED